MICLDVEKKVIDLTADFADKFNRDLTTQHNSADIFGAQVNKPHLRRHCFVRLRAFSLLFKALSICSPV